MYIHQPKEKKNCCMLAISIVFVALHILPICLYILVAMIYCTNLLSGKQIEEDGGRKKHIKISESNVRMCATHPKARIGMGRISKTTRKVQIWHVAI